MKKVDEGCGLDYQGKVKFYLRQELIIYYKPFYDLNPHIYIYYLFLTDSQYS